MGTFFLVLLKKMLSYPEEMSEMLFFKLSFFEVIKSYFKYFKFLDCFNLIFEIYFELVETLGDASVF